MNMQDALASLLRFEPEQGRIWLDDYRMVMLSACALGVLRKELIETLGWDRARGLLKRFGYAAGLADAVALAERFAPTGSEQLELGPLLHALEGIAKVSSNASGREGDPDEEPSIGKVCGSRWENSFEAEQHLDLIGKSEEPVCWILSGYAAGHASAISGERVLVVETQCMAMGFEHCQFVTAKASEEPELYNHEEPDYAPQHLPEVLRELHEVIAAKDKAIVELRSAVERVKPRGHFVGESKTLAKSIDTAQAVAPYSSAVLILGESGTGKELLARFVHDHSKQAAQNFIAVNCSALPESLQEAELFGYAKGAFTGAAAAQAGVFEAAHGGTLFLDEIGDLSPSAQTKILRALQEGEIKRLGETRTREARPRIIAATHRDLNAMVREGSFREDLYYRLNVVVIPLPPLRERGNDILLLADHFRYLYAARFGKSVQELSHEAALALTEHPWPGNVRELENVIQRAVILATSSRIEFEDLPEIFTDPSKAGESENATLTPSGEEALHPLHEIADESERLRVALDLVSGNRERAATLLGISRTTLWRRMKSIGIDPPEET